MKVIKDYWWLVSVLLMTLLNMLLLMFGITVGLIENVDIRDLRFLCVFIFYLRQWDIKTLFEYWTIGASTYSVRGGCPYLLGPVCWKYWAELLTHRSPRGVIFKIFSLSFTLFFSLIIWFDILINQKVFMSLNIWLSVYTNQICLIDSLDQSKNRVT